MRIKDEPMVCFIDDGIGDVFSLPLLHDLEVVGDTIQNRISPNNNLSHGGMCASIFHRYATNAKIISIKVLDSETRTGRPENLCTAIKWCAKNNVKLINLSVGSVLPKDIMPLYESCRFATEHGVTIISACSNRYNTSWPACFDNVIGVKCDETLFDNMEYGINTYPNGGIEFTACGIHTFTIGSDIVTDGPGNSYAAPIMTVHAYNLIEKNPDLTPQDVKRILCEQKSRFTIVSPEEQLLFFKPTNKKRDIPLVVLWGDDAQHVMEKLESELYKENYLPICFTEKDKVRHWVKANSKMIDRCVAMADFYEASLILFLIDEQCNHSELKQIDVGFACGTGPQCNEDCEVIRKVDIDNALETLLNLVG